MVNHLGQKTVKSLVLGAKSETATVFQPINYVQVEFAHDFDKETSELNHMAKYGAVFL